MTFEEIVNYRRSFRLYKDTPIDPERVRHCLRLASLSPNSSNMQMWEFYHITDSETLKKLAVACLSQKAATSAQQMVVFVTRQDLYRRRANQLIELESQNVLKNSPKEKHEKIIKTCALAAQTFMLAMAAEINMVISCGIRAEGGVWGDRMRVPFEEVYKRV